MTDVETTEPAATEKECTSIFEWTKWDENQDDDSCWGYYNTKSIGSIFGSFSAYSILASWSLGTLLGLFSILCINCVFSILSINSTFAILSIVSQSCCVCMTYVCARVTSTTSIFVFGTKES